MVFVAHSFSFFFFLLPKHGGQIDYDDNDVSYTQYDGINSRCNNTPTTAVESWAHTDSDPIRIAKILETACSGRRDSGSFSKRAGESHFCVFVRTNKDIQPFRRAVVCGMIEKYPTEPSNCPSNSTQGEPRC